MKLYTHHNGTYTLINHQGEIYAIMGKYIRRIGTGMNYRVNGELLRQIPNHIKRICFTLNKKKEG